MPTIEDNLRTWGREYDWSREGDEWSGPWGGTEMLWWGSLFPRIRAFVPAPRVLEIAPGYGRLSHYLRFLAEHLIVVDLNRNCIEACRERFSDSSNIEYHVNDGRSLEMVADRSIDFAFSWDSLVHADRDSVESYVRELSSKLSVEGVAFIHHSNLAASGRPLQRLVGLLPGRLHERVARAVFAWRSDEMSAERFASICQAAGLRCITQELVPWCLGTLVLSDCISVCTLPGSRWDRAPVVKQNRRFHAEARGLKRLAELYGARDGVRTAPASDRRTAAAGRAK